MGGFGSTRWNWHTKKVTVEECQILSIFDLKREGILESKAWRSGILEWKNAYTGKRQAVIDYELNTLTNSPYFRVYYTIKNRWNNSKQDFDYRIRLQTSSCTNGGMRWWFTCPSSKDGSYCGERVGKLYRPPGRKYFGCRHCYDLTYRSSQESDTRVNALRKLGPLAILQGIESGDIDFFLGLKALPDDLFRLR